MVFGLHDPLLSTQSLKAQLPFNDLGPCSVNNIPRLRSLCNSFDFLKKESIALLNFHDFDLFVEVLLAVVNPDIGEIVVITEDLFFKIASSNVRLNSLFPIFFVFYL